MRLRMWIGCIALMLATSVGAADKADYRHEVKPLHGGVVAEAAHIDFELVAKPGSAVIYVRDHGKPVPTQGASGKLTVLTGKQKTDAPLKPAGHNGLAATGQFAVGAGTKLVAIINLPGKKPIVVRFALE